MEKSNLIKRVGMAVGAIILTAAPLAATAASSGATGEAIAVRLPGDLCTLDERYLPGLFRKIGGRSDYAALIDHMYENCPQQLAGMPTASIVETTRRDGDERTAGIPETRSVGEKPRSEKPGTEAPATERPGGEERGERGGREERGEKGGREERGEKGGREERGEKGGERGRR